MKHERTNWEIPTLSKELPICIQIPPFHEWKTCTLSENLCENLHP